MGFAVPLARWLRGPLRSKVSSALLGQPMAETNLFNMTYVGELIEAHMTGRRDYSTPLWTLLMFEAFLRGDLGQNHAGLAAAA
jgi:asparagine synthase (glutamine-hydrolysing)